MANLRHLHLLLLLALLQLQLWAASSAAGRAEPEQPELGCLDESGRPLDWFIVYKFPKLTDKRTPQSSGEEYVYLSSASTKPGWTQARKPITSPDSMVLRSLAPVWRDSSRARPSFVFYSDQPPVDPLDPVERGPFFGSSNAHAKGALLLDDKQAAGLYLLHSVPNFPPPVTQPLAFEENFKRHGQTFMCVSFGMRESGAQILEHLAYMRPLVYGAQVTRNLVQALPELRALKIAGLKAPPPPKGRRKDKTLAQTVRSRAGRELFAFSKSSRFKDDIWAAWLDDALDADLYVQSWRRGNGSPLDSDCPEGVNEHRTNNVKELGLGLSGGRKLSWSFTQDHSKWAISADQSQSLVCVGDINRMASQFKRGGGALCIKCPSCWAAFSALIRDVEGCPVRVE